MELFQPTTLLFSTQFITTILITTQFITTQFISSLHHHYTVLIRTLFYVRALHQGLYRHQDIFLPLGMMRYGLTVSSTNKKGADSTNTRCLKRQINRADTVVRFRTKRHTKQGKEEGYYLSKIKIMAHHFLPRSIY